MPYKVLYVASKPHQVPWLMIGEEHSGMQDVSYNQREQIEWSSAFDQTLPIVFSKILSFSPNIIHFSGHGTPNGELVFSDKHGQAKTASIETVAELFASIRSAKQDIKCVIFNTCYSEDLALSIAQYFDYVIAVHGQVHDQDAVEFSRNFYQGLANGMSPLDAFKFSCKLIETDNGATLGYLLTGRSVPHDARSTIQNDILYYFSKLIRETVQPARTIDDILDNIKEKSPSRVDILAVDCFDVCHMQLSLRRNEEKRVIAEPRVTGREAFLELQESISFFNKIISAESLFAVVVLDPKEKAIRRRWNKNKTAIDEPVVYHMDTLPYLTLTLTVPRYK